MKDAMRVGLTGTLTCRVPARRAVRHLLPESAESRAVPEVPAHGRHLHLTVEARDPAGVVARGSHRRAVVHRTRFDARTAARATAAPASEDRTQP